MLVGKQISGLVCYSVPKGYAVIVAHAIMMIWACAERILCVPIDYGHVTFR